MRASGAATSRLVALDSRAPASVVRAVHGVAASRVAAHGAPLFRGVPDVPPRSFAGPATTVPQSRSRRSLRYFSTEAPAAPEVASGSAASASEAGADVAPAPAAEPPGLVAVVDAWDPSSVRALEAHLTPRIKSEADRQLLLEALLLATQRAGAAAAAGSAAADASASAAASAAAVPGADPFSQMRGLEEALLRMLNSGGGGAASSGSSSPLMMEDATRKRLLTAVRDLFSAAAPRVAPLASAAQELHPVLRYLFATEVEPRRLPPSPPPLTASATGPSSQPGKRGLDGSSVVPLPKGSEAMTTTTSSSVSDSEASALAASLSDCWLERLGLRGHPDAELWVDALVALRVTYAAAFPAMPGGAPAALSELVTASVGAWQAAAAAASSSSSAPPAEPASSPSSLVIPEAVWSSLSAPPTLASSGSATSSSSSSGPLPLSLVLSQPPPQPGAVVTATETLLHRSQYLRLAANVLSLVGVAPTEVVKTLAQLRANVAPLAHALLYLTRKEAASASAATAAATAAALARSARKKRVAPGTHPVPAPLRSFVAGVEAALRSLHAPAAPHTVLPGLQAPKIQEKLAKLRDSMFAIERRGVGAAAASSAGSEEAAGGVGVGAASSSSSSSSHAPLVAPLLAAWCGDAASVSRCMVGIATASERNAIVVARVSLAQLRAAVKDPKPVTGEEQAAAAAASSRAAVLAALSSDPLVSALQFIARLSPAEAPVGDGAGAGAAPSPAGGASAKSIEQLTAKEAAAILAGLGREAVLPVYSPDAWLNCLYGLGMPPQVVRRIVPPAIEAAASSNRLVLGSHFPGCSLFQTLRAAALHRLHSAAATAAAAGSGSATARSASPGAARGKGASSGEAEAASSSGHRVATYQWREQTSAALPALSRVFALYARHATPAQRLELRSIAEALDAYRRSTLTPAQYAADTAAAKTGSPLRWLIDVSESPVTRALLDRAIALLPASVQPAAYSVLVRFMGSLHPRDVDAKLLGLGIGVAHPASGSVKAPPVGLPAMPPPPAAGAAEAAAPVVAAEEGAVTAAADAPPVDAPAAPATVVVPGGDVVPALPGTLPPSERHRISLRKEAGLTLGIAGEVVDGPAFNARLVRMLDELTLSRLSAALGGLLADAAGVAKGAVAAADASPESPLPPSWLPGVLARHPGLNRRLTVTCRRASTLFGPLAFLLDRPFRHALVSGLVSPGTLRAAAAAVEAAEQEARGAAAAAAADGEGSGSAPFAAQLTDLEEPLPSPAASSAAGLHSDDGSDSEGEDGGAASGFGVSVEVTFRLAATKVAPSAVEPSAFVFDGPAEGESVKSKPAAVAAAAAAASAGQQGLDDPTPTSCYAVSDDGRVSQVPWDGTDVAAWNEPSRLATKVFVSRLGMDITPKRLVDAFRKCGAVTRVEVWGDRAAAAKAVFDRRQRLLELKQRWKQERIKALEARMDAISAVTPEAMPIELAPGGEGEAAASSGGGASGPRLRASLRLRSGGSGGLSDTDVELGDPLPLTSRDGAETEGYAVSGAEDDAGVAQPRIAVRRRVGTATSGGDASDASDVEQQDAVPRVVASSPAASMLLQGTGAAAGASVRGFATAAGTRSNSTGGVTAMLLRAAAATSAAAPALLPSVFPVLSGAWGTRAASPSAAPSPWRRATSSSAAAAAPAPGAVPDAPAKAAGKQRGRKAGNGGGSGSSSSGISPSSTDVAAAAVSATQKDLMRSRRVLQAITDRLRAFTLESPMQAFVYFADKSGAKAATSQPLRLFGVVIGKQASPTSHCAALKALHIGNLPRRMPPAAAETSLNTLLAPLGYAVKLLDTSRLHRSMLSNGEVVIEFGSHAEAVLAAHYLRGAELEPGTPLVVGWSSAEEWRKARPAAAPGGGSSNA